jgi:subtilisin family serine protease
MPKIKRNKFIVISAVLVLLVVFVTLAIESSKPYILPEQQISAFASQQNVVAVLDTGVDFERSLLKGKELAGYCFSESRGDIESLCYQNKSGKNCLLSISNECNHGTYVAGILAQRIPEVQIVSYQTYSKQGKSIVLSHKNYIDALDHIIQQKQNKIINFSAINISWNFDEFYMGNCDNYKTEMTQKIAKLNELGIKTYVSTGNDGKKNLLAYPACVTGVIPVGAKELHGKVSSYSNNTEIVINFGDSKTSSIYPGSDKPVENIGTSFAVPQVIARDLKK